jgi:hypothetical protein
MNKFFIIFLSFTTLILSQNYSQDENEALGSYADPQFSNWEETCYLVPKASGKLKSIFVYLAGEVSKIDTLRVINDPSEGEYPSSYWVSGFAKYNTYAEFIINFNQAGWYELDVSNLNLDIGGRNRVGVQHIIKPDGPFFVVDKGLDYNSSFIGDVFTPNPNFFNIRGTIFSVTAGDYFVRAEIDWDFEEGNDAQRPDPKLIDVTNESQLLKDSEVFGANEAAIIDYNNDGFDDISIAGDLFVNTGNGSFERMNVGTSGSRLAWADIDNDGYLDAFSASGGANDKIFWGSEEGMVESTPEPFLQDLPTMSPIFFDMDLDGDLDIYIAHNRRTVDGSEVYYRDQLYRNEGNREFTNITDQSDLMVGESSPQDCYGANIVDFNNDGAPDVFVATYRLAPDRLYYNDGTGVFFEISAAANVQGNPTFNPDLFGHGMGSDWGDYNNDGFMDLAVGNLGHPDERGAVSNPSLVFKNNGDETFSEVHKDLGIQFFEMNSGVTWIDINNDGWLDLWHNQYSYDRIGQRSNNYSRLYINGGSESNFKFDEMAWKLGADIHGSWTAQRIDYDNDGDYDLLVCSAQENVKLFKNDLSQGNYLKIRLEGDPSQNVNNNAYGSQISVVTENNTYYKQLAGTQNHGRTSQSSDEIIFGLGDSENIQSVTVKFSNGTEKVLEDVSVNSNLFISLKEESELKVPELFYPVDNQKINSNEVTLNWKNTNSAKKYTVQISDDIEFSNILHEKTTNSHIESYSKFDLEDGEYFWRVKAENDAEKTDWSEVASFVVGEVNSVNKITIVESFSVSPNPSIGEVININLTLDSPSHLNIEIIDLFGNLVYTIHSDFERNGDQSFVFDPKNLSGGTYFVRINTDKGSVSKKIQINK